jgi:hypothetical protein
VGEVALSQAQCRLRDGGTRPPNPKPERTRSRSPNQSPIRARTPESGSKEESDLPLDFGVRVQGRVRFAFGLQSPSPRKSPICFTPESESKEEPDFRWTPESVGLKSPIQNKSDSVRFLGDGSDRVQSQLHTHTHTRARAHSIYSLVSGYA